MDADVRTQTVTVVYDPQKTSPEELAKAITQHTEFQGSVLEKPAAEADAGS